MKQKRCKACKEHFLPARSLQQVCSLKCASEWAKTLRERKEHKQAIQARQERRQAKEKLKTRGEYIEETQKAVNRYIVLRDADLPCISCGKFRNRYEAGHYLARSIRPELRFDEDNIHKQCTHCNNYNKGVAQAGYRPNLIKKIGLERVEKLEEPHPPAKWTKDELVEMKKLYRKKVRELEKRLDK